MNPNGRLLVYLFGQLQKRRTFAFTVILLLVYVFSISSVSAQNDPDSSMPPPPKILSKEERDRLKAENEIKPRTKLALELMNIRITSAEKKLSESDFEAMIRDLGAFEALLDNQLNFLVRNDNDSGRILDNFKRFEIGLRTFVPRIESIRRELPSTYEPVVRNVGKYIRDARTRALEPLFSDTVIRQPRRPDQY